MAQHESDGRNADQEEAAKEQYLVFRVGRNLFGTPLLDIQEIVKVPEFIHVPNTSKHFLGVFNLRGQIAGAVDLRIKLGYPTETGHDPYLLVFPSEEGLLAALIDEVIRVESLAERHVDRDPQIVAPVPLDFLIGISSQDDEVMCLVKLLDILTHDEIVEVSKMVTKADAKEAIDAA